MWTVSGPITKEITPPSAGTLVVSVVFDLWWQFGSPTAQVFCEQGATVSYGEIVGPPPRNIQQSFRAQGVFSVAGGTVLRVGIKPSLPGVRWFIFENLALVAEFTPS